LRLTLIVIAVICAGCNNKGKSDQLPSRLYDGKYIGVRQSNLTRECGIRTVEGNTSAVIKNGHVDFYLFNSKTLLVGTVAANGKVHASGIWPNPTRGFPGVTTLDGYIQQNVLIGNASDLRCNTDITLKKINPRPSHKPKDLHLQANHKSE
jgi:hypothetical protein